MNTGVNMKMRKEKIMSNNFNDKSKSLFIWLNCCILCGEQTEELSNHHILGRTGEFNSSPLNLARVCLQCHEELHGLGGEEREIMIARLLIRTFIYLNNSGYLLTEEDEKFYEKNEKYYLMFNKIEL